MNRHPRLTIRSPEFVSAASARVSEADIRKWFVDVYSWFDAQGKIDILSDPSRVFNGDETSFYLHPKTRAVIAETGSRNVYEVERANSKENITVMFSFSADGQIVDPFVILSGRRIRKEVAQAFPANWGLEPSERGWMNTEKFLWYIKHKFHPFLVKNAIQLPVVFFVDGHSSHVAIEVADQCQELGIILVALYPNTTRITQPADVAIFKPLKNQWKKCMDEWSSTHEGEIFTVIQFGPTLEKAVNEGIKKNSIINGFRVCGLYPFNADNVDYTKCLAEAGLAPEPSNLIDEQQLEGIKLFRIWKIYLKNHYNGLLSKKTPLECFFLLCLNSPIHSVISSKNHFDLQGQVLELVMNPWTNKKPFHHPHYSTHPFLRWKPNGMKLRKI